MIYLTEYDSVDRGQDRITEHRLGRELLQFGLEREYGIFREVVREGNGKPFLKGEPGIDFSIAHTAGLVVCGIQERRIGVDVEQIRQFDERLMRRICTEEEMYFVEQERVKMTREEKFFHLWTLKESFLKATGQGLAVPMRETGFSIRVKGKRMTDIRGPVPGWKYMQYRYRDSYIISICEEEKNNDL